MNNSKPMSPPKRTERVTMRQRRHPRAKHWQQVSVGIPDPLLKQVDDRAKQECVSRSDIIRRAVREHLRELAEETVGVAS